MTLGQKTIQKRDSIERDIFRKIQELSQRRLNNYHDACDLSQEVIFQLEKNRSKWENAHSRVAWAMGVFNNQFKCFLRRKKKRHSVSLERNEIEVTSQGKGIEDKLIQKEQLKKIKTAIRKMNPKMAESLKLFFFENKSIKEISQIQEVPTGTVKWRIFEAKQKIAQQVM